MLNGSRSRGELELDVPTATSSGGLRVDASESASSEAVSVTGSESDIAAAPQSRAFYIQRVGYNDIVFYEGKSKKHKGPPAFFVEVSMRPVGWDITLRRGGTKQGEPVLHLKKAIRLLSCLGWDKGSKMKIREPWLQQQQQATLPAAQLADQLSNGHMEAIPTRQPSAAGTSDSIPDAPPTENGPASSHTSVNADIIPTESVDQPLVTDGVRARQENEAAIESASVDDSAMQLTQQEETELDKEVEELHHSDGKPPPLAVLKRKHQYRSNRNVFTFNGRTYAWDYFLLLGALHTLKDVETGEVVAKCQLKPWVQTQSVTAWGLRQNGVLEIMGSGLSSPQLQDMIIATLIGMLEWRKHNNKVWIILLAAIPF